MVPALRLALLRDHGTRWPPGVPSVQAWRDVDGRVFAEGYEAQGRWWMSWAGVGTFLLDPERPETVLVPESGVDPHAAEDAFRRGVTPLVLLQRELEVLHASAVVGRAGIVAFCATSGTGKSTLAAAVAGHGCVHWADDFVALSVGERGVCCPWLPSRPRLDADAVTAVALPRRAPLRDAETSPVREAPLAAIAILERDAAVPGGGVDIERTGPQNAFTALLPHAHECQIGGSARVRRSLERYLDICARVPIYRVAFSPDLGRLRTLARSVAIWVTRLRAPAG